jgi:CubicO group peptidase (beta-lactamase class C family)
MMFSAKVTVHMLKSFFIVVLALTFGLSVVAATPVPLTQTDADAWLDGMMPSMLQTYDAAGAVIVIVKDGKVLTQRGYGFADVAKRTPVDPAATLFRSGSISKLFTWTAVMQLVEQGKIDLDADINTYLDFRVDGRGGKKITMRHLMTHRGGFEETIKDMFTYEPQRNMSIEKRLKSFIPKYIANPGEVPAYSNYGTTLAGYIVQRVSRMPFDDYIEKAIFQPLKMQQSSFRQPLPKSLMSNMSKGYPTRSDPALPFEYISVGPAGSLSSTGSDMARFMIAHLQNGQSLMKPETAQLMHNSSVETVPGLNRMLLGFYETNLNGHRIISHGGDTIQFHSNLHLFLDNNVGLFMSFNSSGNSGAPADPRDIILQNFVDRYFGGVSGPVKIDPRGAVSDANSVAGHYARTRRFESNFLALTNIFLTTPVKANDDGSIMINTGSGDQQFVHVGPMLWADPKDGTLFGAKTVNGRVKLVGINPAAAIFARQPVSIWHSGAVTIPSLAGALFVYLLIGLSWPVNAIARRFYNVPAMRNRHQALTYIASRAITWATFAVLVTWFYIITLLGKLAYIPDMALLSLQIVSAIIGIASIVVAIWRVKLSFAADQRWFVKIEAIAFLCASLFIAWAAWMGGIYAMTINY